jgi:hypothetical protein
MSGWGCAHDDRGVCTRVADRRCDPGMKGCVLAGRYRFSNPDKNRPRPAAVRDPDPGPTRAIDGPPGDGEY